MKEKEIKNKYNENNNNFFCEFISELKHKRNINSINKILLIQIPQLDMSGFNLNIAKKNGYYNFPPTGLQYLASSIMGKNCDIELSILDLNFEILKRTCQGDDDIYHNWETIVSEAVEEFRPQLIGVSCMYDSGIPFLQQLLKYIRSQSNSFLLIGGIIASYEYGKFLSNKLCDIVLRGESEEKIDWVLKILNTGEKQNIDYKDIFFCYNDIIYETSGIRDATNFDYDLIPSYSLINIEEYCLYGSLNPFSRMAGGNNTPYAALNMNRGCRGHCSFCSVRDYIGAKIRTRPVDTVLKEMEYLINVKGVRHFEWLDDDLLYKKSNIKHLLQTIIDKKWNITWAANNGLLAASIDEHLMSLISQSGCVGFKIGIETGNPEMLKKIKKPATLDAFRKATKIINKYNNIFVGGNYIVGFPDEYFYQMLDTFFFILELNLDWAAVTVCQAIRGATAFEDFGDYFDSQIDGNNIKNYIPTRGIKDGELQLKDDTLRFMDIFSIPENSKLSSNQIDEIWFTFNMLANFIFNKNITNQGKPEKFIHWVTMVQCAYPLNPYMNLFLAIAHIINGDDSDIIHKYYNNALQASQTNYWQKCFKSFGIIELIDEQPMDKNFVCDFITNLREKILNKISKEGAIH